MKAVEKDRTRRYATADTLAQDIERHLNSEVVSAAPPSTAYLVRKFIRRHRRLLTTAAIFSATLFIASVISVWLAISATNARGQLAGEVQAKGKALDRAVVAEKAARDAQREAQAGELRARRIAYASDMHNAYQAKWLATGEYYGGIRVWNILTRQVAHTLLPNVPDQCGFVDFTPEGERLYATTADGVVKSWSVPSFLPTDVELRHGSQIVEMCISHDSKTLAVFGVDGKISLWDLNSPTEPIWRQHCGHGAGDQGALAFSPDGQLLAVGNQWEIQIWDLNTREEALRIP